MVTVTTTLSERRIAAAVLSTSGTPQTDKEWNQVANEDFILKHSLFQLEDSIDHKLGDLGLSTDLITGDSLEELRKIRETVNNAEVAYIEYLEHFT